MGVMVDRHFGDDGNARNFKIPSYAVWDLTGDYNLQILIKFNLNIKLSGHAKLKRSLSL